MLFFECHRKVTQQIVADDVELIHKQLSCQRSANFAYWKPSPMNESASVSLMMMMMRMNHQRLAMVRWIRW